MNARWAICAVSLVASGCGSNSKTADPSAPTPSVATVDTNPSSSAAPTTVVPVPTSSKAAPKDNPAGHAIDAAVKSQIKSVLPPGADGWTKANITAQVLASRIGQALAAGGGIEGDATLFFTSPDGSGQTSTVTKIKDSKTYRVEVSELRPQGPVTIILSADGKHKATFAAADKNSAWSRPVPADQLGPGLDGQTLVKRWPLEFPKLMMSWFVNRRDPWAAYVGALAKGVGGYKVIAERRTLMFNGKPVALYRFMATGPDGTQVEAVVDAKHYLPVTMRSTVPGKNGKGTRMEWNAAWQGGQKFPIDTFDVPKS